MDVVINSLDSPGTSSGYCSGTEEEITFTVSMFESSTVLPTGCLPDIFAGGGGGGTFPSFVDATSSSFPDGPDSLIMMTDAGTSASETRTWNDEEEAETEVSVLDDGSIREFRDSWLFEMLFGGSYESSSSTSHDIDDPLRFADRGRTYELDLDAIDIDVELLLPGSMPDEGRTREAEEGACPTKEVQSTIDYRSSPEEERKGCAEAGIETTVGSGEGDEEDWNALMSFDDWDEVVCGGGEEEEETLLIKDGLMIIKDIWTNVVEEDQSTDDCQAAKRKHEIIAHEQDPVTLQLSPPDQTTRFTCSAAPIIIASHRIEHVITTSESTSRIDASSSWTSSISPRSFRSGPRLRRPSTGSPPRPRTHFRCPQPRTPSTTSTMTTTTHHMLEDHRYSTRRIDQVVKPVQPTTSTSRLQLPPPPPEVDGSSRFSVLETLLRTNARFNPNHGSSFIVTKESKRRHPPPNRPPPILHHSSRQQSTLGGQSKEAGRRQQAQRGSSQNNTLLHDLLTCRMDEVEKRRVGGGGEGGIGKSEQRRGCGRDQLMAGKSHRRLVVGLIPSDDPVVDCSFLYDEDQYQDQYHDQDQYQEDHCALDARMAWMERAMEDDNEVVTYASDDEGDTWFSDYFNQSS